LRRPCEREAQERVLKAEVESATSLSIVHREDNESIQTADLLEGGLMDARLARDMVEANF
jgi:hypothetical protein